MDSRSGHRDDIAVINLSINIPDIHRLISKRTNTHRQRPYSCDMHYISRSFQCFIISVRNRIIRYDCEFDVIEELLD